MAQNFTISVPDQLWVDKWEADAEKTYTYDGPETVYVLIDTNNNQIKNTELEEITPEGNDIVIAVTAADYPERAMMVLQQNDDGSTHEFSDETNFDGSVYKKITNPRLTDYFDLTWHPVPDDWDAERGLELDPIYKMTRSPAHDMADNRLAYVTRYSNQFAFDTDTQTILDDYITAIEAHIVTLSTAYPWKFDGGVPTTSIPKIPAALVTAFNALPDEVS